MNWIVRPTRKPATGGPAAVAVPGDKSISHRALMLAALAAGDSKLRNLASGADVQSTASCLRALGVEIEQNLDECTVRGGPLRANRTPLDCGNSGTTMRLLSGILAGQPFASALTGDESLRRRPMERIAKPLREMGAEVITQEGHAPVDITGGRLRGITFLPAAPSAQVKSCVLLAGLLAEGTTTVVERVVTRDHTERLLQTAGVPLVADGDQVTVKGGRALKPINLTIPGDFSSAAFPLVFGALHHAVTVEATGVNPTRTAFLSVLRRMGAEVVIGNEGAEGREPVGDVSCSPGELKSVEIGPNEAPLLIDELPLVALLGAVASGRTRVTGAAELRSKESDRIAALGVELRKLAADIAELEDGFEIRGGRKLRGAVCESHGDHRIAMMLALAGSVAEGETVVRNVECADISFPGFTEVMSEMGVDIGTA